MAVDLDAIEAALAKMTAGPWEVDVRDRIIDSDGRLLLAVGDHCINAENDANAAGIVLLRNAAHALLAELRRWRMATFDATPDAVAQTVADLAWSAASEGNEAERLRADLAAARLDAANARSVAVEAIDLLDARLNPRTIEGYVFKDEAEAQLVTLRTRLASPADFAARVTAAVDRLVLVAASEFPGSAKVDAARAEADAAIGVARG